MLVLLSLSCVALATAGTLDSQALVPLLRAAANTTGGEAAVQQRLVCYDSRGQYGESHTYTDYAPFLSSMDNRIESCCFTGVWLLYGQQNYNGANSQEHNFWAYGTDYCTDMQPQFMNEASSLRYSGHPQDMYRDSINLYFMEYFMGDEEFAYQDAPFLNYDNRARSIIVTGSQWWTVYEGAYYGGYSACLAPGNSGFPAFYPTAGSLHNLANSISSVRMGCYSSTRLLPGDSARALGHNATNASYSAFH